jgi:hypothetical protein
MRSRIRTGSSGGRGVIRVAWVMSAEGAVASMRTRPPADLRPEPVTTAARVRIGSVSSISFVLSAVSFVIAGVLGIGRGLCDQTTCGSTPWIVVPLVVPGIVLFVLWFVSVLARRGERR